MKRKVAGIVFIIGSLYYILAEAVSATYFNASLFNTYIFHTISELGIPNANSPLFWLMNSAFILIGLTLIFGDFYKFKDYIIKNKVIFYILTLVTGLGVIIVGLIHGGNPLTSGYHTLGAVMAILGGNVLLMLISRSMADFNGFQKLTLVLGVMDFIVFWIMFFNMKSVYMPVFERLSVYTLIIWSFSTGLYLYGNENHD
ncbi:MAG: DUF998 domain-containing protein [Methanobrevibacter sp.]|uniref:DUF998 domain-containing protein n=1 Tax=Methanobrevibacter sp. TaxID=66852 RepID=UPI002E792D93|nr:DUF998 domain-containing protein [Methanobrevibacter sp.]MEE0934358.1 DUF998 domain-containing protein [Methanobrevibacter sp.]